jgi:glucose-6-phosphate 1-dehydrogenase
MALRSKAAAPVKAAERKIRVKRAGKEFVGEQREFSLLEEEPGEQSPYERLLGDVMNGDRSLFAGEDAIEAAWRVVDPVLRDPLPVVEYEPGSWGPAVATDVVAGNEVWHDPIPERTQPC